MSGNRPRKRKRSVGLRGSQPIAVDVPVLPPLSQGAIKVTSSLTANRNHYFAKSFTAVDDYWISFDVAFDDNYLSTQESEAGGYDSVMIPRGHIEFGTQVSGFGTVNDTEGPGVNPLGWYIGETNDVDSNIWTFEALTWYHIDYHSNHPVYNEEPYDLDVIVDGTPLSVTPQLATSPTTSDQVAWGLTNYHGYGTYGFTVPLSIYLKQMMIGTSQGASDIFDGRYLSTSNWPFDGIPDADPDWVIYDTPPF